MGVLGRHLSERPVWCAYCLLFCSLGAATWSFWSYYALFSSVDLVNRGLRQLHSPSLPEMQKRAPAKFLVANRSPEYLKKSAIKFAEKKNLGASVRALYERDEALRPEKILLRREEQRLERQKKQREVAEARKRRQEAALAVPDQEPVSKRYRKVLTRLHNDLSAIRFCFPLPRGRYRMSSPFGPRRKKNGRPGYHWGIDFASAEGTAIYAAADGVVECARNMRGYGNTVVLVHGDKIKTRYAHMCAIKVHEGDEVQAGAVIGLVGKTGHVWGRNPSHLHFEIEVNKKRLNPLYFLRYRT